MTDTNTEMKNLDLEETKVQEDIRRSINAEGPLYVPEGDKDSNYRYYWPLHDIRKPFKFTLALNLGYTFVSPSEMVSLGDHMQDAAMGYAYETDGDRIGVKVNQYQTHYLMKIPKERFEQIQKIKDKEHQEIIDQIERKPQQQGFYGSISTQKRA